MQTGVMWQSKGLGIVFNGIIIVNTIFRFCLKNSFSVRRSLLNFYRIENSKTGSFVPASVCDVNNASLSYFSISVCCSFAY